METGVGAADDVSALTAVAGSASHGAVPSAHLLSQQSHTRLLARSHSQHTGRRAFRSEFPRQCSSSTFHMLHSPSSSVHLTETLPSQTPFLFPPSPLNSE